MNTHAQHYNQYLAWKRKALYITLGVITLCVITHGAVYVKLLKLQSSLTTAPSAESVATTNEPDCAELEKIVAESDKNAVFAWLSTLVQALPAHVKIEEFEYTPEHCTITLAAKDRATYIACLERFDNHYMLSRLRVEKQYCFIMKS